MAQTNPEVQKPRCSETQSSQFGQELFRFYSPCCESINNASIRTVIMVAEVKVKQNKDRDKAWIQGLMVGLEPSLLFTHHSCHRLSTPNIK
jgi:hypothetical protein